MVIPMTMVGTVTHMTTVMDMHTMMRPPHSNGRNRDGYFYGYRVDVDLLTGEN